jgi:archaetidylinositol phosphate synthase
MSEIKPHMRVNDILLGPLERPALQWLAVHMPAWVNPDILTGIGIGGSFITLLGYALSNLSPAYLWLSSFGFVVNWFGDSLDGTLARYRHIERPRYGYFIDHTMDAFSEVLVVGGLGLSPYVNLDIALLALIGYLLISILVYIRTYVAGVFKISYGKLGPTEVRLILIAFNTLVFFIGAPVINLPFITIDVCNWIIGAIAIILMGIFTVSTIKQSIALARLHE